MRSLKNINWIVLLICIFSLIGLIVSFVLTIEKIELIKDSGKQFECNINAVIQCGSVMKSKEADLFGFPSSIIGIIGYTFIFGISLYSLFIKKLDKYFALILLLGSFIALIFSYFLLLTSVFKIQAICPYCVISCFSATNIFFALLIYIFKSNSLSFSENKQEKIKMFIEKQKYWPLIIIWYAVVTCIITLEFIK